MSWLKTVTKQGLSVLAGLDGENVKIVSAWAGTGFYVDENLYEQTSLKNPKQSLPIIEDAKTGNKRVLRLQVTNAELETGYALNQLGVFISVNGGEPILYYLAQNDAADDIPSKQAAPGFVSEYIVTLVFAAGVDPEIDTPETGFITNDAFDAKINALKSAIAAEYGSISASIPIAKAEPAGLKDGEWWYEEVDGEPIELITVSITTLPYDETKPFHIETDSGLETMEQVTDDEAAAAEEDLIMVSL